MFKKVRKTIAWSIVTLLMVSTMGGCGSSSQSNTQPAANTQTQTSAKASEPTKAPEKPQYKELTVYSALGEEEVPVYFNAFEKDTGIHINYVRLSAGEILARLQAEKNNPQASVFHGGSTDNFIAAAGQGLLEKYQLPEAKDLPEEYLDKDGNWTPFYIGAICFANNKNWFTKNNLKYPESWEDLLKPEFKGQISISHPSTSGTAYTVLATLVQLMGEDKAYEYLKKLSANVRQYTKGGSAPAMEVALGEAAIGISFSHDSLKPAGQGYPVELSFPKDGTGYEIGGLGIIKNSPEKERDNAKKFIDWCVSKRGQELFEAAKSFRMPLNKTATPPKGAIKVSELKTVKYDAKWAGENRKRLIEKFVNVVANANNLKQ